MSDTSFLVFMTWFFRSIISMFVLVFKAVAFVVKVAYLAVKNIVKAVIRIVRKIYHHLNAKDEPERAKMVSSD